MQTYVHIIWRTWITIKLVENPWRREKDINVSQWKFIYLTKINQETLAEYICRAWLSKMVSFIWKCNRMCLSVCSVRSCWPQNRYDYPLLWIVLLVQVRFITILSKGTSTLPGQIFPRHPPIFLLFSLKLKMEDRLISPSHKILYNLFYVAPMLHYYWILSPLSCLKIRMFGTFVFL